MSEFNQSIARGNATSALSQVLAANKVLKNTYMLLALTLGFSALMAVAGYMVSAQFPQAGIVLYISCTIAALVILFFVMPRYEESTGIGGLVCVFLFTGLLGFGLGPVLSKYLAMANGAKIVGSALAGTGVMFLALSAYALTTKKRFNFLAGFLFAGFIVVLVAAIANIWLQLPAMSMAISFVVILLMSGFILYDTSAIIHGEETNYIRATVGIYLSIYNIFTSLLSLLRD